MSNAWEDFGQPRRTGIEVCATCGYLCGPECWLGPDGKTYHWACYNNMPESQAIQPRKSVFRGIFYGLLFVGLMAAFIVLFAWMAIQSQ